MRILYELLHVSSIAKMVIVLDFRFISDRFNKHNLYLHSSSQKWNKVTVIIVGIIPS
jgi:hypothetical protein